MARAALAGLLLIVGGCAAGSDQPGSPAHTDARSRVTLPPETGEFDYQLGGDYAPSSGVSVLTRDSTGAPAKGVYSICYINGFQTQPGVSWPASLVVHTADGKPLVDPGWPDEQLIDTSTAAKRAAAAARQEKTITMCADKGFQAVELDNLDSWTRSKGALDQADAVAFAKLLVTAAHDKGLAASQKNATDLTRIGKETIGFDFVTAEECDRYDECGAFTKVYGRHVLDIEYTDDLRGSFSDVCARPATPRQTVLRDRDLVTPGDESYAFQQC